MTLNMTMKEPQEGINRRTALKVTALAGGGLALHWMLEPAAGAAEGAVTSGRSGALEPQSSAGAAAAGVGMGVVLHSFARIRPDNIVEFVLDRVEMGQGTATSQAMLFCEELEYPLAQVEILHAPNASEYNNSKFFLQMTGGSTSVAEGHEKLRQAGAEVRERLRQAAAKKWKKDLGLIKAAAGTLTCSDDPSLVSTYGQLASEAVDVKTPKVELKPWSSHTLVGKPAPRVDAVAKSTGRAIYSIDFAPKGSAVAVLIRPPKAGAKFASFEKGFDEAAVRQRPGVLAVVQAPGGVAVIAERYWQARAAAGILRITWDESRAFQLSTAEILDLHRKAAQTPGRSARSEGKSADAFRAATKKIVADYEVPYLAHATMEPQCATVLVRDPKSRVSKSVPVVEIWASTQVPDLTVSEVAETLGCGRDEVQFSNTYLGGGFGRKLRPDAIVEAVQIAVAARSVLGDRPVQLLFSREDDMHHDDYRPMAACHVWGSVDDQGKMSSLFYRCASQSLLRQAVPDIVQLATPQWFPLGLSKFIGESAAGFGEKGIALEGIRDTAYQCPNLDVEHTEVELPIRVGFWRSVGHSINGFVVESFIDELAHVAGVDPYRFRRAHLPDSDRRAGVLDRVAQLAKWGSSLPEGVFEGIAVTKAFDSYVAQVCRLKLEGREIRVLEFFTAIDCGRVVNPDLVRAQIESGIVFGLSAALTGAIDFEKGAVVQSNFHDYQVLRHDRVPRMETEIVPSEEPPTGVGELGTPLVVAAVCNALFRASGQRIRSLPLSRSFVPG